MTATPTTAVSLAFDEPVLHAPIGPPRPDGAAPPGARQRRRPRAALMMIAPALILFGIFIAYPLVRNVWSA
jgi:hypothetical protein